MAAVRTVRWAAQGGTGQPRLPKSQLDRGVGGRPDASNPPSPLPPSPSISEAWWGITRRRLFKKRSQAHVGWAAGEAQQPFHPQHNEMLTQKRSFAGQPRSIKRKPKSGNTKQIATFQFHFSEFNKPASLTPPPRENPHLGFLDKKKHPRLTNSNPLSPGAVLKSTEDSKFLGESRSITGVN